MKIPKRILEVRTLPALEEQRNSLLDEMDGLLNKAKAETRALSDDENTRFNEIRAEIEKIDNTIKAEEEARALDKKKPKKKNSKEEQRALEEQNFINFIRGEERALSVADNGGIIPERIANKIIEEVKELSPIYSMATIYNVGGNLIFPKYGANSSKDIKATYVEDLTELTEQTGKFTTVKLENYIVGCLAKISKSLINRTDFDLLNFVIKKVAQAIAEFMENELINGTVSKMQGLSSTTNVVKSAATDKISGDDLIDVQMSIPEKLQANACWIMHKKTLKSIRKLKDADGNYLLGRLADGFGWELLGKKVYISESCKEIAAEEKVIFYGDMSGLYVKLAQNVEIQVLNEKYATQHAIGVVGYVECDSKIVEEQKIAALQMKEA